MKVSLVIALALALCCVSLSPSNAERCLVRPVNIGVCKVYNFGWVYDKDLRRCQYMRFACKRNVSAFPNEKTCKRVCGHLGLAED
ncbi:kappaPI-actitoxin-Avd3c-like [Oratosquilla oratoria]|uniref:kappaPI-actitoxin-Avd3c-like n=1 Tax=Oratosquilla oratoria TaxID=337810 RepID=UPI003F75EAAA